MNENLALNLRTLCSYYPSISQVCKLAKINRQQFNKYLAQQSTPSLSTLRKINDFFGLQEDEIFLERSEFQQLIDSRPRQHTPNEETPLQHLLSDLLLSAKKSQQFLKPYVGVYHDYYCSPSNKGKMLRALICIYQKDGITFTKSIERLPYKERDKQRHFSVRYHGIVQAIEGRLVFTDIETRALNNWAQRVYYPVNRTRIDILCGLTLAISGGLDHQPFCCNSVLERLSDSYSIKTAIKQCSLYALDSPDIRADIKEKLKVTTGNHEGYILVNS